MTTELHQKQKEVINSEKRYKLLNWGRRSGKTFVVGYEIFIELWNKDNALVSYYAPTRGDARDISWEDFKDLLKDITVETNETLLEIKVNNSKGGTSLLRLAGWEAVKNRDKGRGVENDLVVLDECAFFPVFLEKFEKVIEPTLLTSKGRLIITSTPNGFNHFYDLAQQAQEHDDWFFSHATSYDNPHNDPAELATLRERKTEDSFAQEYLADFRKMEGLVYKEFDRTRHISTCNDIRGATHRGCVDFGFTNPTAMYTVTRDHDANYFITDEFYERGMTHDQIIQHAKVRKVDSWYPDPAEAPAIELMRREGMRVNEVDKSVLQGIDTVRTLFLQNRLFIHPSCKHLIGELETYRYKPDKADQNAQEEPVKENDHALDAVRYALYMWETTSKNALDLERHYAQRRTERKTYGAAS